MADPAPPSAADGYLDPDQVATATFAVTFRGWDQSQVAAYLGRVADALRAVAAERDDLAARALDAETRAASAVDVDDATLTARLGDRTAAILAAAHASAAGIVADAEAREAEVVREAQDEARRLRDGAEAERRRGFEEGAREAEALVVEAERRRVEVDAEVGAARAAALAEVEASRQQVLAAAEAEGRELVAEARAAREMVLGDLTRRRRSGRRQLEQLTAARERLLSSLGVVKRAVEEATADLRVALPEARSAAEAAARRSASVIEPTVAELEADIAALRTAGLTLGDLAPASGTAGPTRPGQGDGDDRPGAHHLGDPTPPATEERHPQPVRDAIGGRAEAGDETVVVALTGATPDPDDVAAAPPAWPAVPPRDHAGAVEVVDDRSFDGTAVEDEPVEPWVVEDGTVEEESVEADRDEAEDDEGERDRDDRDGDDMDEDGAVEDDADGAVEDEADEAAEDEEDDADGAVEDEADEDAPDGDEADEHALDGDDTDEQTPDGDDTDGDETVEDAAVGDETAGGEAVDDRAIGAPVAAGGEGDEAAELLGTTGPSVPADEPEAPAATPAGAPDADRPPAESVPAQQPATAEVERADGETPLAVEAPAVGLTGAAPVADVPAVDVASASDPEPPATASKGLRGADVDALFARLRGGEPDAGVRDGGPVPVAPGPGPTTGAPPGPVTPTEPVADEAVGPRPTGPDSEVRVDLGGGSGREALLARRDEALDPLVALLARRLKRTLADEQNDLLDRLRRHDGADLAAVVPDVDDRVELWAEAAAPVLVEAAAAGAALVDPDGASAADEGVGVLTGELVATIVAPLRERVMAAVEGAEGDIELAADGVRGRYREWRSLRVDEVARHLGHAAFARGAYDAALGSGTPLCWVADDGGVPCPDAEDNVLAGAVAPGSAYPTGDLLPPAHPGCRCLLVPASEASPAPTR